MWEAPPAPREEGQISWYGMPTTEQFKDSWAKGKSPGYYVLDLEEEAVYHHEGRAGSWDSDRIDRTYRRDDPASAKEYWYIIAEHRSMVHDPADLAVWDAYVEANAPTVRESIRTTKVANAKSSAWVWFLIILFVIAGLLYNMTSCSFNDPLNHMM